MAAGDPGGPGPDLYQLLGVPHEASREDIVQAWRRRAQAEHPDSRPGPVRVEVLPQAPGPVRQDEEVERAVLAGLALRYLARDCDWPW